MNQIIRKEMENQLNKTSRVFQFPDVPSILSLPIYGIVSWFNFAVVILAFSFPILVEKKFMTMKLYS